MEEQSEQFTIFFFFYTLTENKFRHESHFINAQGSEGRERGKGRESAQEREREDSLHPSCQEHGKAFRIGSGARPSDRLWAGCKVNVSEQRAASEL